MKSLKKILSFMLVLAIILSLALCFGVSAMASTSTSNAAVQAAADGVFHVVGYYSYEYLYNTYVDDPILGFVSTYDYLNYYYDYTYGDAAVAGSAFLIGYNSSGQAVLLSNYHVTENETAGIYYDENGVTISSFNIYDHFAVSILGTTVVEVDVANSNSEYDFSILYAQGTIANRSVLALNPDTQNTTEVCYALGFPAELSSIMKDVDFTTSSVTVTQGTITNVTSISSQYDTSGLLVPVYQTNATISSGCSGGPLVNSNGEVIGINSYSYTTEEANNYYYAIQISKVCEALDYLGIEWTDASQNTDPTPTPEPEPTEAVEVVTEVTEAPAPTEEPAATEEPAVATPEPEAESSIPWAIIIIIAAVIVVAIIVVVIIMVTGKSKKTDGKSSSNSDYQRTLSQPQSYDNDRPTDILGGGYDDQATTILGGNGGAKVCLVRESTGERVPINKTVFRIGSKRGSVDYVITNNTAISRNHASIVSRNGEYFILDNNSSNFTFVNGTQLTPNTEVRIHEGDSIRLADENFRFENA
ncbi:MAG: trypsin-like peptidase domain-containing protein [Oscillospiraceae bacterium]|nr:trypsin-like peptidase domain-containing protein [Oscillospiraceae bacterium]